MTSELIAQLPVKSVLLYQRAYRWTVRIPVKARVVMGLFFVAAVMLAVHTALTTKDASLHVKLQHTFHNAQVIISVDGDLAYSGRIVGSNKKRFGLIPTDSVQGSLSEIIPLRSGPHKVSVRIETEDAAMQEDSISGYFDRDTQRDLSAKWPLAVLARKQLVGRNVIQLWMVLTLCRLLPTHHWWFHRFGP